MILVDKANPNKVFAVSDVNGVSKSTNYANRWNYSTEGITSYAGAVIAQAPSDPTILYYGASNKLFKSTTNGTTWTDVTLSGMDFRRTTSGRVIAINYTDPSIVYVGSYNGVIYKTTSGGSSWVAWATPWTGVAIRSLMISRDGNDLLVGSASGLYHYDLATGTGTDITPEVGKIYHDMTSYVKDGTEQMCVTSGLHILCSIDKGASFSSTTDIPQAADRSITRFAVAVDASNTVRFMAGWQKNDDGYTQGIYRSVDGGTTWANAKVNFDYAEYSESPGRVWHDSAGRFNFFDIDPVNPDIVYTVDWWGMYRSDDFGGTWVEKIDGAMNYVNSDITVSPNGIIFNATMDNGVTRTTDGGLTWQYAIPNANPLQQWPDAAGHYWRVITLGTKAEWDAGQGTVITTNTLWNPSSNYYGRTIYAYNLAKSTDNGVTWRMIHPASFPSCTFYACVYGGIWGNAHPRGLTKNPANENEVYVSLDGTGSDGGIWRSSDKGETWTKLNPPNHNIFYTLEVDPTDGNRLFYCSWNGNGCYWSEDKGETFTAATGDPGYAYHMSVASDGIIYVAAGDSGTKIYKSTDHGRTYSVVYTASTGRPGGLYVNPANPAQLFFSTQETLPARVLMSENRGSTWTDITGDLPDNQGPNRFVIKPDEGAYGYLYFSSVSNGTWKINLDPAVQPTYYSTTMKGFSVKGWKINK